jgi:hypothetical protein
MQVAGNGGGKGNAIKQKGRMIGQGDGMGWG